MLQKAYDTAKEMLLTHRDVLERIAGYLYEHETITGKEFMDIFNEMAEAKQPIDVDAEDVTVQTEEQTAEMSENETELPEMSRLHRKKLLKNKKARSNPYNQDRNGQSGVSNFRALTFGIQEDYETYMETEKLFDIREELKKLPDHPGVYIMHDDGMQSFILERPSA